MEVTVSEPCDDIRVLKWVELTDMWRPQLQIYRDWARAGQNH